MNGRITGDIRKDEWMNEWTNALKKKQNAYYE